MLVPNEANLQAWFLKFGKKSFTLKFARKRTLKVHVLVKEEHILEYVFEKCQLGAQSLFQISITWPVPI